MSLLQKILGALAPPEPGKLSPIAEPNKYGAGDPLYFPENLRQGDGGESKRYPHFMKFSIYQFEEGGTIEAGRKIKSVPVKSIYLHIPDNLTQTQTHEYSVESITTALARYGLAGEIAGDLKEAATKLAEGGKISESLRGLAGEASTAELAGQIAEGLFGAGQGTTQLLNAIASNRTVNPRYESIYTGSRPREFTFDFKLAPQNKTEADSILNIVKSFRYFSAPERAAEFRYLLPPNPFTISFYFSNNGIENQALFKIKACVLQGVDVNYSTTGQFATFNDGMPVEMALQLRFTELQTLHKTDIEAGF